MSKTLIDVQSLLIERKDNLNRMWSEAHNSAQLGDAFEKHVRILEIQQLLDVWNAWVDAEAEDLAILDGCDACENECTCAGGES